MPKEKTNSTRLHVTSRKGKKKKKMGANTSLSNLLWHPPNHLFRYQDWETMHYVEL